MANKLKISVYKTDNYACGNSLILLYHVVACDEYFFLISFLKRLLSFGREMCLIIILKHTKADGG